MKLSASAILIFMISIGLSQKQSSLQLYFSPVIQKFGNLNHQYIDIEHENITVDYTKKPSQQFGFNFLRTYSNNWGWAVGADWKNDFYRIYYQSVRFYPGGTYENGDYRVISSHNYQLSAQMLGINLGGFKCLNKNIKLTLTMHFYARYNEKSNLPLIHELSTGSATSDPPYGISEKIRVGDLEYPAIVPDLNFCFRVYKSFYFTTGARLKFWSPYDYYSVDVYGSFETNEYTYDETKILHQSRINSKELSYYFGLVYELPGRQPE